MTLVQLLLQDGYPRANNGISLIGALNLSGGVLPPGHSSGTTRRLNLLLMMMNQ